MKLSQYDFAGDVERDGEFASLGYADTNKASVLAFADNVKYLRIAASNPNVSCILTVPELAELVSSPCGLALCASPRDAFYDIHTQMIENDQYARPFAPGRGADCQIHPSAVVGEGCLIGDRVKIGEHVVVRDNVWIGSDVTVDTGVKLGVDGILYSKMNSSIKLIPHGGYVRIHDGVSLMTNSVVVRSIHDTDATEVGRGSLIGLGSIVGHEAKVGEGVVVSNQCVLARRSSIGNNVFIGTNSMIREHVVIGDDASVMAGSVVIKDVAKGASVSGNFATDHKGRMIDFVRGEKK